MRFAQLVFAASGIYGLLLIPSMGFLEARIGLRQNWADAAFLLLAMLSPLISLCAAAGVTRIRLMLVPAFAHKLVYGLAGIVYLLSGRVGAGVLPVVVLDTAFGALFLIAYLRLRWRAP